MAIYRAVGGVNREIKGITRSVGGVNKTIKEVYRSVGNVNRKVYESAPSGALYWDGDECTELTGGWLLFWNYDGCASFIKESNYLYLNSQRNPGIGGSGGIGTSNKINLAGYSKLHFIFSSTSNSEIELNYRNNQISSETNGYGYGKHCTAISDRFTGANTLKEAIISLDNYQSINTWLGLTMHASSGKYSQLIELKVYRVWLE